MSWGFSEQARESTCSYGAYILVEEDTQNSRKQTRAFQTAVSAIEMMKQQGDVIVTEAGGLGSDDWRRLL